MGYLHIDNLYKNQDILLFKECWALEKIHGTSAFVGWNEDNLTFHTGEGNHQTFVDSFDSEKLTEMFNNLFGQEKVKVYGEYYGGKIQVMKETYGPNLKFIAFEMKVGDCWLSTPQAHFFANKLGLEFVHYVKIPTTIEAIYEQRDSESIQAIRNGMGPGKPREGVVLHPLIEVTKNNGERVLIKCKGDAFKERLHPPKVLDPEKAVVLSEAAEVAEEWVIPMRLEHVLQSLPQASGIEHTSDVITAMIEDVYREAKGEIVESREVSRAIGRKASELWKQRLKEIVEE